MNGNEHNLTICTIDDLNRVLVPHNLRTELNWGTGIKLTLAVSKSGLEFSAHEGGAYSLDDYGRVTLSQDLMETMNWSVGEKITLSHQKALKAVLLSN